MPSVSEIGQFTSRRAFQLRLLLEGFFYNQDVIYKITLVDGHFGENDWLFSPGYIFQGGNGDFILSLRGHISRLQSENPSDIVRWIKEYTGHQAILSEKDDIIAYEKAPPKETIDQIIDLCNSAPFRD